MTPPQTFSGISPDRFARLTTQARAAGIEIDSNSGSATKFGVHVGWNYDPATEQLTLQCLSTPFFIQPADIDNRLRALVEESAT
jgi:hypothetical protein